MLYLLGHFLYWVGTKLYFILVQLFAPFNHRAKDLLDGQKGLIKHIQKAENEHQQKCVWFHVSSLGEFEQGRPVMEALKAKYPQYRLVVTIFSPSGYHARKNDSLCDAVYFLPFESKKNAELLVQTFKPVAAVWVKYDFWFAYLHALNNHHIPTFLIAAQFRPTQIFFKPFGVFKRDLLKLFTHIFCQNQSSLSLLHSINIHQSTVSGDNRFDRVFQTTLHKEPVPFVSDFCKDSFILIAGSSYAIEENMLLSIDWNQTNKKLIIAPHFVQEARIVEIEKKFGDKCVRYSSIQQIGSVPVHKNILIIDSIGWLSKLYQYAHAAFIGGGFVENGLHNCLEAAAFGMPICFGPKLKRFPEAQLLVQEKIATCIYQENDFTQWFNILENDKITTQETALKSRNFVASSMGATEKVMLEISRILS
jgi:3-deoxy-D-manno-octulosonic-acid transferase